MYVLAGTVDTGMVSIHYIYMQQWCIHVLSGVGGGLGGGLSKPGLKHVMSSSSLLFLCYRIYEIEERLGMPINFRHPCYEAFTWFAAKDYV